MPGPTTPITIREKAVLFLIAYGLLDDWETAYFASEDKSLKDAQSIKFPGPNVSKWKNSHKVQQQIKDFQELINENNAKQRFIGANEIKKISELDLGDDKPKEKAQRESEPIKEYKPKIVSPQIDYNDPKARKDLYNRIIASSYDDPKTQLDAAKLIEQTQKDDKQAAKEGKSVRVYLPLSCDICPLAQKARKKGSKV